MEQDNVLMQSHDSSPMAKPRETSPYVITLFSRSSSDGIHYKLVWHHTAFVNREISESRMSMNRDGHVHAIRAHSEGTSDEIMI
ncbi:hypothetical protein AKJ16_DCAP00137, partial [Drosera capensis]